LHENISDESQHNKKHQTVMKCWEIFLTANMKNLCLYTAVFIAYF